MPSIDPDALGAGEVRYSTRRETPGQVWWNRISVTAGLFATAMFAAVTLGRRR